MNDNAQKWVAALRSGEYKQAKGVLKNPAVGYCCLGIACELYGREHGIEFEPIVFHGEYEETESVDPDKERFLGDDEVLPEPVKEWLGLQFCDGIFVDVFGKTVILTDLNDGGVSFEEIADVIESEPAGLFA